MIRPRGSTSRFLGLSMMALVGFSLVTGQLCGPPPVITTPGGGNNDSGGGSGGSDVSSGGGGTSDGGSTSDDGGTSDGGGSTGGGGSPNDQPQPGISYLPDMLWQGKTVRWNQSTIRVAIDTAAVPSDARPRYEKYVTDSLQQWEEAADGRFTFQVVPGEADIPIHYTTSLPDSPSSATGTTDFSIAQMGSTCSMLPEIFLLIDPLLARPEVITARTFRRAGKDAGSLANDRDALLLATALHEIGHAIGLLGHSTSPNDIMFEAVSVTTLSANDVASLHDLYDGPADCVACSPFEQPGVFPGDTPEVAAIRRAMASQIDAALTQTDDPSNTLRSLMATVDAVLDSLPVEQALEVIDAELVKRIRTTEELDRFMALGKQLADLNQADWIKSARRLRTAQGEYGPLPAVIYVNGVNTLATHFKVQVKMLSDLLKEAQVPLTAVVGVYNPSMYGNPVCGWIRRVPFLGAFVDFAVCRSVGLVWDLLESGGQLLEKWARALPEPGHVNRVADRALYYLEAGSGVIFVAHSQGNLSVQQAINIIEEKHPDKPEYLCRIRVISIATPTAVTPADLMPADSVRLVQINPDIITSVFGAPKGNTLPSLNHSFNPIAHHSLESSYLLEGSESRKAILQAAMDFATELRELNSPESTPPTGACASCGAGGSTVSVSLVLGSEYGQAVKAEVQAGAGGYTYCWDQVSGPIWVPPFDACKNPTGPVVVIDFFYSLAPVATAYPSGDYVFRCAVTNAAGGAACDDVTISIK